MSVVIYQREGKVAYITLNRPERLNALNRETCIEMAAAWQKFKDDEAWVAILTGAGERAFCAGFDVSGGAASSEDARYALGATPTAHDIWKPVIAAVHGYCLGGGFLLAQECDVRVASEEAQFGLPEPKLGLATAFSSWFHRYLPAGPALELLLWGDPITASRAYELGFVNKVVPRAQLMEVAKEMADRVCTVGPIAVRRMKELFYAGRELTREQGIELMSRYFDEVANLADTTEGIQAFLEKRKPKFEGR